MLINTKTPNAIHFEQFLGNTEHKPKVTFIAATNNNI